MPSTIPFTITVCGLDELASHSEAGVTHVLSILDPDWPVPEVFGTFGEHRKLELRFNDVIESYPGVKPPQPEHVEELLSFGRDMLREPAPGAHLLVHCHAGVSRSTASMILMVAQAQPERESVAIGQEILALRPQAWPNLKIIELGDAMLGRDGTLVAAAIEIYRERLRRQPDMARAMIDGGRAREVAAARGLL